MKSYRLFTIVFLACLLANSVAYARIYEASFESKIVDAADKNRDKEVEHLIKSGISVNARGAFNATALMRAAYNGNLKLTRLLVSMGADINAVDIGGATALHLAARRGQEKVVDFLLNAGALYTIKDREGYTAEARAKATNNIKCAELISSLDQEKGLSSVPPAQFAQNDTAVNITSEPLKITVEPADSIEAAPTISLDSESVIVAENLMKDQEAHSEITATAQDLALKVTVKETTNHLVAPQIVIIERQAEQITDALNPNPEQADFEIIDAPTESGPSSTLLDIAASWFATDEKADAVAIVTTKEESVIADANGETHIETSISSEIAPLIDGDLVVVDAQTPEGTMIALAPDMVYDPANKEISLFLSDEDVANILKEEVINQTGFMINLGGFEDVASANKTTVAIANDKGFKKLKWTLDDSNPTKPKIIVRKFRSAEDAEKACNKFRKKHKVQTCEILTNSN